MASLPIVIVDLREQERTRVAYALEMNGLSCTAEQAEEIAAFLRPLPTDTGVLAEKVLECVAIDWSACPIEQLELTLRKLAEAWEGAAEGPRKMIGQRMLFVTKGLDIHPTWWELPCACDECLSCV